MITGIARGELETIVPVGNRRDEISAVLGAVETLRQNSVEKAALEVERQGLIDELRISSTTDFLTGLTNRRAFVESAQTQLASARRHGLPLSLIMLDIDNFKDVNDRYGHDAGDVVLIALAALAKAEFRVGDIVCRYGGEEFAVLAPHCGGEAAMLMTERVRAAIAEMPIPLSDGRSILVTASFGIVGYAMMSAPDLFGLLARGARYSRLISDALTLTVAAQPDGCRLVVALHGGDQTVPWQRTLFTLLSMLSFLRWVMVSDLRPLAVELTIQANAELEPYQAAFGCPLRFGAAANALRSFQLA